MRLILLLTIFSLSGCGLARPKVDLCIINAPNLTRGCHNMATDYDDAGNLLPGHPQVEKSNKTVADLNKALVLDGPDGPVQALADFKAWLNKLRNRYKNCTASETAPQ